MAGQTITHKAGDTLTWSLVRTDDAGDPVDITGVPVDAVFVRGPAKIELVGAVTDGPAGEVTFTVSAEDTAAWLPGLYTGDVSFGSRLTTVASTDLVSLLVERGYYAS